MQQARRERRAIRFAGSWRPSSAGARESVEGRLEGCNTLDAYCEMGQKKRCAESANGVSYAYTARKSRRADKITAGRLTVATEREPGQSGAGGKERESEREAFVKSFACGSRWLLGGSRRAGQVAQLSRNKRARREGSSGRRRQGKDDKMKRR